MTLGTRSLLALSLCAALGAACKKKAPDATGTGSAGTGTATPVVIDAAPPAIDAAPPAVDAAEAAVAPPAAAGDLPPELQALDATLKPILEMTDEAARTKAACKALTAITKQIATVGEHPPAGVDAAEWLSLSERVGGGLDDFAIDCGEGSASSTKALAEAAEAAKEFLALLAHKPG